MSHNPNSRLAHKQVKKDGTASRQQKAIHALLSDGIHRTSRELSECLKMERSSTCGRLNTMKDRGDKYQVFVSKNDKCPTTGKLVEFYTVGM